MKIVQPDIEPAERAVDREHRKGIVMVLRGLLEKAESGELTNLVAVGEINGDVRTFFPRPYRLVESLGVLRLAEIGLIEDSEEFEEYGEV